MLYTPRVGNGILIVPFPLSSLLLPLSLHFCLSFVSIPSHGEDSQIQLGLGSAVSSLASPGGARLTKRFLVHSELKITLQVACDSAIADVFS